jgi:hypothetical protein
MGMSHANLTNNKVMAEFFVTDEVSIWKQIFAHIESNAGA